MALDRSKIDRHMAELEPVLDALHEAMKNYLNERGTLEALEVAYQKWCQARQKVIDLEGVGIVLKPGLSLVAFPLSGDPSQDIGQGISNKLKN